MLLSDQAQGPSRIRIASSGSCPMHPRPAPACPIERSPAPILSASEPQAPAAGTATGWWAFCAEARAAEAGLSGARA